MTELIVTIVTALAAFLFGVISNMWPDFPLTLESFTGLLVWIALTIIGVIVGVRVKIRQMIKSGQLRRV